MGVDKGNLQVMGLKKNQSTPRPSEHPPVMGGKMGCYIHMILTMVTMGADKRARLPILPAA